ncbi:hypothetical protein GCM10010289_37550 [Streptomyces violascens]|uniref:Uncharacterized protein n=1 Tax=Streptomyces violascens TaxID=67381 RepID=A0ABQ3QWZ5_9ACTN|nr:hypothetical protein GCM10010289_37550 [Streptomyces violascens]GHI41805.1 hypothetical protein Sviol_62130 [Streptomyces violascens]
MSTVYMCIRLYNHISVAGRSSPTGRNVSIEIPPSPRQLRPHRRGVVDSPDPGRLLPDELGQLLRELVRSERCAGFDITICDPDLDPDGTAGALLADLVVGAFAQS